jgi:sterol desaturase/sphingolipid hydroxylase (fatty acid hydroxylase superfamily)
VSSGALILSLMTAWFVALAVVETLQRDADPGGVNNDRLITNFGFSAAVLAIGGLIPLARISSSLAGEGWGVGLANLIAVPWIAIFAALLLLDSLAAYWAHRAMHAIPLLWRIHRVHHADSELDVSSSLRNHPLELIVTAPVSALVVLVVGAPLSVVVASQTLTFAAALWQHADIRLPKRAERMLAGVIITPRLHRLHHNPERVVHDTNFGESLVLWDWLFGTLNVSEGRRPVGLEGQRARADRLLDQIWSPLQPA